jgi:hypothetical protein
MYYKTRAKLLKRVFFLVIRAKNIKLLRKVGETPYFIVQFSILTFRCVASCTVGAE